MRIATRLVAALTENVLFPAITGHSSKWSQILE
jgi:hypothetical protein